MVENMLVRRVWKCTQYALLHDMEHAVYTLLHTETTLSYNTKYTLLYTEDTLLHTECRRHDTEYAAYTLWGGYGQ